MFLMVLGKMDGDEHALGINWKVLGMLYFILLDLTPLLSLCTTLILFFIFRLYWFCLGRCNFAFLIELQSCISQQKSGRLRTGVKWSSGLDHCHITCFSEGVALNKTTHPSLNKDFTYLLTYLHRGGALHSLWECRAFQLWVDLHLIYNQNLIYFQNIVRMFLLHFNLKCSRYIPLALMFTSGLSYTMPQNVLEKIIITIRFLILIFHLIIPQKCFIFQKVWFMVPQKYLNFSKLCFMGIVGEVAPCGSISSQNIPIWAFEIMLFESSQHEDSNYQY